MSHKLVFKEFDDKKNAYFYVEDFDLCSENLDAYVSLDTEAFDVLFILINSYGGDLSEYFRLKTILEKNKNYTTELQSVAYGVGAFVFLSGEIRVGTKWSEIMIKLDERVNSYDINKYNKRKDYFDKQFLICLDEIYNKKFINKDEYNAILNGEEIWLDYKQMIDRGILTHEIKNNNYVEIKKSKK